jgi:hypothetical protein
MAEAAQQPLAEPEPLGLHSRKGALLENARRTVDATRASPVRQPRVDDLLLVKFTVERQQAGEKPEAWDKLTWEEVAIERSIAVLAAAENFDEEIAQPAECSVDITSPLPRLDQGKWDEWVLHPRLKENRLAVRQPTTTEKQMLGESHRESETARYLLLRYFDFEAMHGRSYRYRVKILNRNPAFEETDVPPKMAEGEFRESPWSEPSSAVTVGK